MSRPSKPSLSLRGWLQSTSLLAVVAGYSILLLINQRLAEWQRLQGFRETADQVLGAMASRGISTKTLGPLMGEMSWPGVKVAIGTAQPSPPALWRSSGGEQEWLVGTLPLDLLDGSRAYVRIEQDVSRSVHQERLSFWLLVVAAGLSCLITSALLRLVLKRGLVQPLQDFSEQLRAIQLPPLPGTALAVEQQPQELQAIAQAFNMMQHRLWCSWEQERTFTDGVAHELRTPISLISGHTQSLLRQGSPEALKPALQLIRSEAERMTSLVSDLLDLARQDSQRLNLQHRTIQSDDALLQLFERLRIKASGRLRLDIGLEQAPEPPSGFGDPDRIQQCLTALVDNALQYSPTESIITLSSSTGPGGSLILHVRDQGPGVHADERERIFDRFIRGSAASAGNTRGSGIGLAVVKLLMEAMGGHVEVCDAPGGGADFQLHLQPFRASDRPPSA